MVLSYTTSPAYHLIAETGRHARRQRRLPKAITCRSRWRASWRPPISPMLADRFLAFIGSDAFQSVIPTTNWMYPAVTPAAGLPRGFRGTDPASKNRCCCRPTRRLRHGPGHWTNGARRCRAEGGGRRRCGGPCASDAGDAGRCCCAAAAAALGPADWAAVRFTLWQAAVSAVLSVGWRCRWRGPGAAALCRARAADLAHGGTVPVAGHRGGARACWRCSDASGLLNRGLEAAGLPPLSIYGFHGVVLAHVFLNLPLAVRMILSGWQGIPSERFRLAASLGMGPGAVLRHLEVPMLRGRAAGRAGSRVSDLPDKLRGGADTGWRAEGDDGGAGDLSGIAVRVRPAACGACWRCVQFGLCAGRCYWQGS